VLAGNSNTIRDRDTVIDGKVQLRHNQFHVMSESYPRDERLILGPHEQRQGLSEAL